VSDVVFSGCLQEYVYVYIYPVKVFVECFLFNESLKQSVFHIFEVLILEDCPPDADSHHSSKSQCLLTHPKMIRIALNLIFVFCMDVETNINNFP
jgi:hypothetical protein